MTTVTHRDDHAEACSAEAPQDVARRSPAAGALRWLIHGYQMARSGRPTGCRFVPSCSVYALEAIDRHGPVRGTGLAVRRVARCNPWGSHGVDPVPDRRVP